MKAYILYTRTWRAIISSLPRPVEEYLMPWCPPPPPPPPRLITTLTIFWCLVVPPYNHFEHQRLTPVVPPPPLITIWPPIWCMGGPPLHRLTQLWRPVGPPWTIDLKFVALWSPTFWRRQWGAYIIALMKPYHYALMKAILLTLNEGYNLIYTLNPFDTYLMPVAPPPPPPYHVGPYLMPVVPPYCTDLTPKFDALCPLFGGRHWRLY